MGLTLWVDGCLVPRGMELTLWVDGCLVRRGVVVVVDVVDVGGGGGGVALTQQVGDDWNLLFCNGRGVHSLWS